MLEGDDRLRVVEGDCGVAQLRRQLSGARQAGGVGHPHDLALDGRAEDGAQQLHRHPWEEEEEEERQQGGHCRRRRSRYFRDTRRPNQLRNTHCTPWPSPVLSAPS